MDRRMIEDAVLGDDAAVVAMEAHFRRHRIWDFIEQANRPEYERKLFDFACEYGPLGTYIVVQGYRVSYDNYPRGFRCLYPFTTVEDLTLMRQRINETHLDLNICFYPISHMGVELPPLTYLGPSLETVFWGWGAPQLLELLLELLVARNLTPDLLHKNYVSDDGHWTQGHCYVAAEACHRLMQELGYQVKSHCQKLEDGSTHWWTQRANFLSSEVLDPTRWQFF